ncbi:crotonase/enoyl-CoA hydratase family protein [Shewanella sp. Isolate11]|uniref:crotonase/enoyl-CoA hydratase family protein n=1 Tax=Shewanella sp. Isolate11 TaxID=2908530 RepID=UPI001EFEBB51|nr:crotonase/enoyl-CoA hydratase family protein [Shewanella sp. Isolate11]MCG9695537.1 crotonase/enoyl-CoA hydratase family protein [Shewanella sp. Isolate11]
MFHPCVKLTLESQIAIVELQRPEKYNALNYEMFTEIRRVQKRLAKDRDIRVVILTGSGGNFCSGLDVGSVMSSPLQALKLLFKWLPGQANLAQQVSIGWRRLPVPVICALEGICYGGGMQIALGADIRVASPDCRLSIMEAKWGLVPDMAGFVGLRELVTKDIAMLLTLSADIIDAQQAQQYGLVTQISEHPLAHAKTLAKQLLNTSPDASAAIKHNINRSWRACESSLLRRETWSQIRLLLGKNRAIAALRQTKDPQRRYGQRQPWW